MGYKIYLNITCSNRRCYGKYWRRSVLINLQCKTWSTLQINVFEIPDTKNIGKLFSKYELLLFDQADFSFDPSQILILQFPTPKGSLSVSSSLPNNNLSKWNSSLTQHGQQQLYLQDKVYWALYKTVGASLFSQP